jgi:signal peptidase II
VQGARGAPLRVGISPESEVPARTVVCGTRSVSNNGVVTSDGDPGGPATVRPRTRMRVFFLVAALVVTADAISKALVVRYIGPDRVPLKILGGVVYLEQARNSGAAFSVGTGATVALTVISLLVIAVILRAARRLTSIWWAIALGFVLGGALGNLADRIFRAPAPGKGHVVDWISVFKPDGRAWPIFNIADSSIVIGGAMAVLLSLLGVDFFGGRIPFEPPEDESEQPGAGAQRHAPDSEPGLPDA